MMLHERRSERALQVAARITVQPRGGNGIAKHPADELQAAPRGVQITLALKPSQRRQNLARWIAVTGSGPMVGASSCANHGLRCRSWRVGPCAVALALVDILSRDGGKGVSRALLALIFSRRFSCEGCRPQQWRGGQLPRPRVRQLG